MELAQGVNLHVIKEKKFKTVRLQLRFRSAVSDEVLAKRALLSYLMEEADQPYPTLKAFNARLAELYGANFGVSVHEKSSQHFLNLTLSVVNPSLVENDNVLREALEFLRAVIFEPLWREDFFELEKNNLLHYLESLNDDNDYVAEQRMQELFYADYPTIDRRIELVKAETLASVKSYYDELLSKDTIDIFALGDVDEDELAQIFQAWHFSDRTPLTSIFAENVKSSEAKVAEVVDEKEAYQSILAMAWWLPIRYGDADYMALQLMNGVFGSLPHSKLFSIVRERESLAYEISSGFDSFTGLFRVMAGIDSENFEKSRDLVLQLLQELIAGDFTDAVIEDTKKMLRNGYFMSQDHSSALIEQAFIKVVLPERYLEKEQWLQALDAVSKTDIQKVAQKLQLRLVYLLNGREELGGADEN